LSVPRDSRIRLSAGVTVRATTIETSTASAYESASGRKNAPVRLPTNTTGSTAATLMSVA
jgi:hypothetical protein